MTKFIKLSGISFILAGLCFSLLNTIILPFVDFTTSFSEMLVSTSFLYRMIFAALSVALLLFGASGLYLFHIGVNRFKFFRDISFLIAFFGSAFMLANEWHQIFILPDVANMNSTIVDGLGSSDKSVRYSTGAMIALITFSLGWILFITSILISKKLKAMGPVLVLAGFFLIPLISGFTNPVVGGISGSVLIGIGYTLIGLEMIKSTKSSANLY